MLSRFSFCFLMSIYSYTLSKFCNEIFRCSKLLIRCLNKKPFVISSPVDEFKESRFIDYKRIACKGGNGGDGMVAFLREANVPFGGPCGGNGGNGGHVVFEADATVKDLSNLKSFIVANNGENGKGKCCDGKSSPHNVLKVPLGTVIKESDSSEIVADLKHHGSIFIAAKGGVGGHGNAFYVSNSVRVPIKAEYGGIGEKLFYEVEMHVMAFVGLVGFPNAGKSSLLRAISRAKPKVASYPFTTLRAHIGIVNYEDYIQIPVADIPGLIEGSSCNVGLGIDFLRHIRRCENLFFVLDPTLSELTEQFNALRFEIEKFDENMLSKSVTIVVNKWDLVNATLNECAIKQAFNPYRVFCISAQYTTGIESLLIYLREEYDQSLRSSSAENSDNGVVTNYERILVD